MLQVHVGSRYTGKERDTESGLDNFGARFDSSNLGRFMSPDPLLSSGRLANPQTWNRYAYALNSPLRFIDPTRLYDWGKSGGGDFTDDELQMVASGQKRKQRKWAQKALEFRDKFRQALDVANEAAGSSSLSDEQQSAAQAAVNAYGTEGDSNGVSVGIQIGNGGSTDLLNDHTKRVAFGDALKGGFLAATVAHEGDHIARANAWLAGGEGTAGDLSHSQREQSAWVVGASIAQALVLLCHKIAHPLHL